MSNEELVIIINSGDDSEGKYMLDLYNQNMGLLYRILNNIMISQDLQEDIQQEFFIWLCVAVKNYDSSYNVKFSHYLYECLKGQIIRFIQGQSICHISADRFQRIQTFKTKHKELSQILCREPKEIELAEYMGLSISSVRELKKDMNISFILSLNEPDNEGNELINSIADKTNPIEELENRLDIEYRNKELWRVVTKETELPKEDIVKYYNGTYKGDKRKLTYKLNKGIDVLQRQPGKLKLLSELSDYNLYKSKSANSFNRTNSSIVEDIVLRKLDYEEKLKERF